MHCGRLRGPLTGTSVTDSKGHAFGGGQGAAPAPCLWRNTLGTGTMTDRPTSTIAVLGGGAWGTARAVTLVRTGRPVVLFARDAGVVEEINTRHENAVYLPGVALDPRLKATTDLAQAAQSDIILLVAPAQATRAMAEALAPHLRPNTPVVICSKGLEQATGLMLVEVLGEVLPRAVPAMLSGPSFADDVVRGLPVALTLASADATLGASLAAVLGDRNFRLYWSDDLVGVQLGGAVKNVLAIAAGIVAGRGLGASSHAAIVTRGFAELRRYGRACGAKAETLMGLAGLGDLVLTAGSAQSRNMSLGRALGEGRSLAEILGSRRSVSEGVYTAAAVANTARAKGIDMPIAEAVAGIVGGTLSVDEAIAGLLSRPFKAED